MILENEVNIFLIYFENREKIGIFIFYVVFCGYYVDIGGIIFGFMFFYSKIVEEEGILIDNF